MMNMTRSFLRVGAIATALVAMGLSMTIAALRTSRADIIWLIGD